MRHVAGPAAMAAAVAAAAVGQEGVEEVRGREGSASNRVPTACVSSSTLASAVVSGTPTVPPGDSEDPDVDCKVAASVVASAAVDGDVVSPCATVESFPVSFSTALVHTLPAELATEADSCWSCRAVADIGGAVMAADAGVGRFQVDVWLGS